LVSSFEESGCRAEREELILVGLIFCQWSERSVLMGCVKGESLERR
jgi:hypothetical protein